MLPTQLSSFKVFVGVALFVGVLTFGSASADVLVLDDDGGPGVDFTTFEEAIAAGQDGDTILIKDGTYDAGLFVQTVTIDNKSLTVVGEKSAAITLIKYRINISNLTPGQRVVFRGLSSGLYAFRLDDNEGTVWVEDLSYEGFPDGVAAFDCHRSSNVIITRSEINGGSAPYFSIPSPGILGVDSKLTVYGSRVTGGSGLSPGGGDFEGATAVIQRGGESFLSGCTVVGGEGGTEAGGDGIALVGSSTTVCRLLDCSITGGDGDPPGEDTGNYGEGDYEFLDGVARSYSISSPDRFLGVTTIRFEGLPGEFAWFPHALVTFGTYIPQWSGVLVTPFDFLLGVGTIPSSGVLEIVLQTPEVEGIDQITFYGQGLFFSATEGLNLGSPSAGILLDPIH